MTQAILEELRNLNPALLTAVVRKQQGSPNFELFEWSVAPLDHEKLWTPPADSIVLAVKGTMVQENVPGR